MRHFNNFTKDEGNNQPEVMKEFNISFKGHLLNIQFICLFMQYPEYFFYITSPKEMASFISKRKIQEKTFWNSKLSQEDSQALAILIEQQTGIVLPEEQTNNPFEYTGDIQVRIYSYKAPGFIIRKAKAPFGNDSYYKISFKNKSYTFGRFRYAWTPPEGNWQAIEPLIDLEELKPFISLAETCDKNNVWRMEDDWANFLSEIK